MENELVRFAPDVALAPAVTVSAVLDCPPSGGTCAWSAAPVLLLPGHYTVTAAGTDRQGNVEAPGAAIRVVVV